jgi:hypothetical protein
MPAIWAIREAAPVAAQGDALSTSLDDVAIDELDGRIENFW